ncbi:MAG TPA: homogentisate phytyltransferase [Euzebyales bacterium]|nr:homogentisate phytyltransferase [Euzebyales bacterium]
MVAFSRPHTIIGTSLSVAALAVLAALSTGWWAGWPQVLAVLVGSLAINVYIVGLNQVTDVDIDRVNKPWLPLASGALTMPAAKGLVTGSAALAGVIGLLTGPYALAAFAVGFVVGTAYSLPPVRLKRRALWAALSIAGVRGLAVNLLLYLHFVTVVGAEPVVPALIVVLTAVVLAISLVIAWFKDIPDMDGDRRFRVRTLTLRLGARRVLLLGLAVLAVAYAAVIAAAIVGVPGLHGGVLAGTHLAALAVLLVASARVDLTRQPSVARFYLVIWALFYAEYIAFPAAGLLA